MARVDLEFPDGPTVRADVTRHKLLAVHRVLGDGKGYAVTHLPTFRIVLWTRLQRDAKTAQKTLEALDWNDWDSVFATVERLRAANLP